MKKALTYSIILVSINLAGCSLFGSSTPKNPDAATDVITEVAPGEWENQDGRATNEDGVIFSSPDNSFNNGR